MIIKKDLFKDLLLIQERMYKVFEDVIAKEKNTGSTNIGTWSPTTDIYETDNNIILKTELPGLTDKDVEIDVIDNYLIIKGERKTKRDFEEEVYHCIERSFGNFRRTFTLPTLVSKDQITASFNNGVLKLVIPKEDDQGKLHKIKIQVE
ncbi:MAG: Hsp20/alpha crystallin family protein [bacterium]